LKYWISIEALFVKELQNKRAYTQDIKRCLEVKNHTATMRVFEVVYNKLQITKSEINVHEKII
jgi:hypothetical protein